MTTHIYGNGGRIEIGTRVSDRAKMVWEVTGISDKRDGYVFIRNAHGVTVKERARFLTPIPKVTA